jgi:hypothetical protein
MTVREFIEEYFNTHSSIKHIRLIDATTERGICVHWIHYADAPILKIKVTPRYIFIFIARDSA